MTILKTLAVGLLAVFISLGNVYAEDENEIPTILLTPDNTVNFFGDVSSRSVTGVQLELMKLSERLEEDDEIYLILNTPGGSVFDGLALMDTIRGVPQKIHTITMTAVSMGFVFAQLIEGKRYILPTGVFMSHRSSGGVDGQFNGELDSRLNFYRRVFDTMETSIAKRMGITLKEYRDKITNELWFFGDDAVKGGAADEVVNIKCSYELLKEKVIIQTAGPFGMGGESIAFSKCPLLLGPVAEDEFSDDEEARGKRKRRKD